MATVQISGEEYEVLDTLEYVTMADSFVQNKTGKGHGEAKLYVGNESDRLDSFFGNFCCRCFFLKKDFSKFLLDGKNEYLVPQQNYIKKQEMPKIYKLCCEKLETFKQDILPFQIYRVNVNPPRVYINSNSIYYKYMRMIGLPNISYLSVLKIKSHDGKVLYYFKMFIDYQSNIRDYSIIEEKEQENRINNSLNISEKVKNNLLFSRIGQGEYRKRLLESCPVCPFTLVSDERLLIASHIKPWVKSDDKEKIDPNNGFMFTPTYDKLFDRGFITFHDDKTLEVSPWISPMNQKRLGIYTGKLIKALPLDDNRKEYLRYHRDYIFKR